jgi:hypothetical protein
MPQDRSRACSKCAAPPGHVDRMATTRTTSAARVISIRASCPPRSSSVPIHVSNLKAAGASLYRRLVCPEAQPWPRNDTRRAAGLAAACVAFQRTQRQGAFAKCRSAARGAKRFVISGEAAHSSAIDGVGYTRLEEGKEYGNQRLIIRRESRTKRQIRNVSQPSA